MPAALGLAATRECSADKGMIGEFVAQSGRSSSGRSATSASASAAGMQIAGVAVGGPHSTVRAAAANPGQDDAHAAVGEAAPGITVPPGRVTVPAADGAAVRLQGRSSHGSVTPQVAAQTFHAPGPQSGHAAERSSAVGGVPLRQNSPIDHEDSQSSAHLSVERAGRAHVAACQTEAGPSAAAERPGSRCSSRAATPSSAHSAHADGGHTALGTGASQARSAFESASRLHDDTSVQDQSEATPDSTSGRQHVIGAGTALRLHAPRLTGTEDAAPLGAGAVASHALAESGSLLLSPDSMASGTARAEGSVPLGTEQGAADGDGAAHWSGADCHRAMARHGDEHVASEEFDLDQGSARSDAELHSGVISIPTSMGADSRGPGAGHGSVQGAAGEVELAYAPRASPDEAQRDVGAPVMGGESMAPFGNTSASAPDPAALDHSARRGGAAGMSGDVHADVALCAAEQRGGCVSAALEGPQGCAACR